MRKRNLSWIIWHLTLNTRHLIIWEYLEKIAGIQAAILVWSRAKSARSSWTMSSEDCLWFRVILFEWGWILSRKPTDKVVPQLRPESTRRTKSAQRLLELALPLVSRLFSEWHWCQRHDLPRWSYPRTIKRDKGVWGRLVREALLTGLIWIESTQVITEEEPSRYVRWWRPFSRTCVIDGRKELRERPIV